MRHWIVNLRRSIKAHLTNEWDKGELKGFDRLQSLGIVPVSSQFKVRESLFFATPVASALLSQPPVR
jgi:hypothetical protein